VIDHFPQCLIHYLVSLSHYPRHGYSSEVGSCACAAGDNKTPYVNISPQMLDSILRDLLLVRQYRVELYGKDAKSPWTLRKKVCSSQNHDSPRSVLADPTLVLDVPLQASTAPGCASLTVSHFLKSHT
jgi:hypothetical protein